MEHDSQACAIALSVASYPSVKNVLSAPGLIAPEDAFSMASLSGGFVTQRHVAERYSPDPALAAEEIRDACGRLSVSIVDFWSDAYPPLLREIKYPPIVLYVRGVLPEGGAVAVVGTRSADAKALSVARRLSGELSDAGFVIVSGMAVGIDRASHAGAMEKKGSTVGVLANGIDILYPRENGDLYNEIIGRPGCALVSEYPPGICAGKWTFVRRNRIISGLAHGTVVVMAGMKSGALITARHALEQNREVFACPGHAYEPGYAGCHALLKEGAIPVSTADDITGELSRFRGFRMPQEKRMAAADGTKTNARADMAGAVEPGSLEERILGIVEESGHEADSIIRSTGEPAGRVNEAIMLLEMMGLVLRSGNVISKA